MKTGRPPLDPNDPSVDVHLRLPSKQYDSLDAQARRERVTVQDVIRRSIDPPKKNLK